MCFYDFYCISVYFLVVFGIYLHILFYYFLILLFNFTIFFLALKLLSLCTDLFVCLTNQGIISAFLTFIPQLPNKVLRLARIRLIAIC